MKKPSQSGPDIAGLLTKLQEQLSALDRKVDSLISRSAPQRVEVRPAVKPSNLPSAQQPIHAHDPIPGAVRPNDRPQGRPMYQATCADCKKDCEIPFKPSGDRPVYCQECFRHRKSSGTLKPATDNKPKETLPVPVAVQSPAKVQEPPAKEKKKAAAAKKPVTKKKPVAKKKKK